MNSISPHHVVTMVQPITFAKQIVPCSFFTCFSDCGFAFKMKSVLFVVFAAALAVTLRDDFYAFEAKFEKNYLPEERKFRARVFDYNMKWARKMNAEGHSFTVGMTPFADMTNAEFATSRLCGCATSSKPKTAQHLTEFDEEVDWREKGAVTEVKNQGSCGSCWAFGAVGTLEGAYFLKMGKVTSLSEQQLVDCDTKSSGCDGGRIETALTYVQIRGICAEEKYPYTGEAGTCKDNDCTSIFYTGGFWSVFPNSGKDLKAAVTKMPTAVGIQASSKIFQMYTGGVIDSNSCGYIADHAAVVVGYKDDYWIVKNSWGEKWGEDGYVRIKYVENGPGICAINTNAYYPLL